MTLFTFVQWIGIEDPTQEIQRFEPRDRFPSVGALSVQFLFSFLALAVPGTCITAANKNSPALMQFYGYFVGVGFFLRFLFLMATLQMHSRNYTYNPIQQQALVSAAISIVEIPLGMIACHLAKLMKLGDEAENKIQPFPTPEDEE